MFFNIQVEWECCIVLVMDICNLLDISIGDGNKWMLENQVKYDENVVEIECIDVVIECYQKVMDMMVDEVLCDQGVCEYVVGNCGGQELINEMCLFDCWVCGGDNVLSVEDWKQVNVVMLGNLVVNFEQGGYMVFISLVVQILEVFKVFGGMCQVVDVFSIVGGELM